MPNTHVCHGLTGRGGTGNSKCSATPSLWKRPSKHTGMYKTMSPKSAGEHSSFAQGRNLLLSINFSTEFRSEKLMSIDPSALSSFDPLIFENSRYVQIHPT